ncbi:hypothetical protein J2853_002636 [Streptosporangium lutulentum]|uniref:Tn3 transposase DDE domain-containing protein n=1 Tax=Streptosporangium lutulentum TaxID=1461250 RepID=A0ABT9QAN4_9ACTN|nr:Tn3 family transposase [Streptosporangium lutulentum]MDP9843425.1 hypothetical protein [Streptosporangium lutulentum]
MLKGRKGAERSKEALKLEEAVHERLPQRDLLDILTRTAYQTGWTRHLGPASGSDPKVKEALGRYVLMVFTYGTLLGPAQVAAHMRGKLIGHNDPDYQEKIIKFNELLANCVIYSTAQDITDAANAIAADGHPVDLDDLATISPHITHVIRRFGNRILNLTPPAANPTTRLDLESQVFFAP